LKKRNNVLHLRVFPVVVLALNQHCDGMSRCAFSNTHKPHPFARRGLDAHTIEADIQDNRNIAPHLIDIRCNLWTFEENCGIDVTDKQPTLGKKVAHMLEQQQTRNPSVSFVVVREMLPDVPSAAAPRSASANRVKKHIGVRMSLQPDVILNFHTTEDKFRPGTKRWTSSP